MLKWEKYKVQKKAFLNMKQDNTKKYIKIRNTERGIIPKYV